MTFKLRIYDRELDTTTTLTEVAGFEQVWDDCVLVKFSNGDEVAHDNVDVWDAQAVAR